jgi:putative oxidoreductase
VSDTGVPAAKRIIPTVVPITDALSPYAEPMIRVAAGLLLVPHGAQKLFGWFGGHGIVGTGEFFASKLGLPASVAVLAGLIEFTGGLLLAVGLATRAAAALVAGLMAVAIVHVHLPKGFFWTEVYCTKVVRQAAASFMRPDPWPVAGWP